MNREEGSFCNHERLTCSLGCQILLTEFSTTKAVGQRSPQSVFLGESGDHELLLSFEELCNVVNVETDTASCCFTACR